MVEVDAKLQLEESMNSSDVEKSGEEDAIESSVSKEEKAGTVTDAHETEEQEPMQIGEDEEEEAGEISASKTESKPSKKQSKANKKESDTSRKAAKVAKIKEKSASEESEGDANTSKEEINGTAPSSGKRDRKKVERLVLEVSTPVREKTKVEAKGVGAPLGESPYIDYMISHTTADNLKILHRLLFNRAGSHFEIKKNIRKFNGFDCKKEDEAYNQILAKINKWPKKTMCTDILRLFGQSVTGSKEELSERLMQFLHCPPEVDKTVPGKKRSTSKTPKRKSNKRASSKKRPTKKTSASSEEEDVEEDDEENSQPDDEGEEGSESEEEKKEEKNVKGKRIKPSSEGSRRGARSGAKKNYTEESEEEDENEKDESDESDDEKASDNERKKEEKNGKKSKQVTKPAPKVPAKETNAAKRGKPDDDSSDDDEPLVKKAKPSAPTNDDIKSFLKVYLKEVNLEEMTMKSVYQKVYDKYPDTDLSDRKDFIKQTVRKMLA